jgi:protein transport protein HofC
VSIESARDERRTSARAAARFFNPWRLSLRQMIYGIFYSALLCWLFVLIAVPLVVGSIVGFVALGIGVSILVARRRSSQQDGLIEIMAIAAEQGMALAPALDAFSEECRGPFRRRVRAAAQALEDGSGLLEVLDRIPGILPAAVEVFARIGWESGNLAGALRESASNRRALRPAWVALTWRVEYLVYLLALIQIIVGFLMFYILPKLVAIFRDFRLPLPSITLYLTELRFLLIDENQYLLYMLVAMEVVILIWLPFALGRWTDRGFPFLDRVLIRGHSAPVLRGLAWVVEGGRPLIWGVRALGVWYPARPVRQRLQRVAQDLEHGVDWTESLRAHRLIRSADAAVLDSARRAGNVAWAMRATAEANERRLAYRLQVLVQTLYVPLLFLVGAVVALIGVAFYLPLTQIIERLAG